jgi:hypothetical protein
LRFACSSCALLGASSANAQEPAYFQEQKASIETRVEIKAHYRWSQADRFPLFTPLPPEFVPVGQENVALQTVAPGSSLEVSKATVFFDVALPRRIMGRAKLDFIDLYDRNPTSTDKKIDVDEAWIAFGRRLQPMTPLEGGSFYALLGKAPKFEREPVRRLESYGLVSTAFNRFNDLQLQVGGALADQVYVFGQVSVGNPIFMRDPNLLAGDNGTAEPPRPDPALHSGFPIFYHTEVEDLEIDGDFEYGGGGGVRVLSADARQGLDLLGFYYRTTLSQKARLGGTFYQGDLELLRGAGIPPDRLQGDERTEYGANLDLRLGGFTAFLQLVKEESANLPRTGFEAQLSYRWASGDLADPAALLPAIEPVLRYSRLDNDWTAPRTFLALSALWNWERWDFGVRATLIRGVDLTLEYTYNEISASRPIEHDEFLTTLRLRF